MTSDWTSERHAAARSRNHRWFPCDCAVDLPDVLDELDRRGAEIARLRAVVEAARALASALDTWTARTVEAADLRTALRALDDREAPPTEPGFAEHRRVYTEILLRARPTMTPEGQAWVDQFIVDEAVMLRSYRANLEK